MRGSFIWMSCLMLTSVMSLNQIFADPGVKSPGTPNQLTATALSPREISLSWVDHADNEQGFRILRRIEGQAWVAVGQTDANVTNYLDATLSDMTLAEYRVVAFNADGETGLSNIAIARTPGGFYLLSGRVVDFNLNPLAGLTLRLVPESQVTGEIMPYSNILDNATIEEPIQVDSDAVISSMKVSIEIRHTYISDLRVSLVHPDGTEVVLHNHTGGSSDNIITTYPDSTAPAQPLTPFMGKSTRGIWKIRITDTVTTDEGFLYWARLSFQSLVEAQTDQSGAYSFSNILFGRYLLTPIDAGHSFGDSPRLVIMDQDRSRVHFVREGSRSSP